MVGWLVAFRLASVGLDARAMLHLPERLTTTQWSGPRAQQNAPEDARLLECAASTLRWARRFVPGTRCVPRALAARVWLARRGVDARVVFGVRGDAAGLAGHAWLEPRPPAKIPLTTSDERDLFDPGSHRVVLREDDPRVRRS